MDYGESLKDNDVRQKRGIDKYHTYVSHLPQSYGLENSGRFYKNTTNVIGKLFIEGNLNNLKSFFNSRFIQFF